MSKQKTYDSSKACQNVLLPTVYLNSSTPKMFVSAQSALEQKKNKIRKAKKFTSLKYHSKPCVNKPTETLRESPIQYQAFGLLLTLLTGSIKNCIAQCITHTRT